MKRARMLQEAQYSSCRRRRAREANLGAVLDRSGKRSAPIPTEAEWEYACRAGSKTRYCFGDDESELGTYVWFYENALGIGEKYAHRVGLKRANAWGLYDMHGNVVEWCQDGYFRDYYENSPAADPKGITSSPFLGNLRVNRGGSWGIYSRNCRSSHRDGASPNDRSNYLGFRVAAVPSDASSK